VHYFSAATLRILLMERRLPRRLYRDIKNRALHAELKLSVGRASGVDDSLARPPRPAGGCATRGLLDLITWPARAKRASGGQAPITTTITMPRACTLCSPCMRVRVRAPVCEGAFTCASSAGSSVSGSQTARRSWQEKADRS